MSAANSIEISSAPKRQDSDFIQSATVTAMMRSVLSNKEGRLKNPDYLSKYFLSGEWKQLVETTDCAYEILDKRIPGGVIYMLIRTKYFDNALKRWLRRHPASQVVILGAGFDTRALRFGGHYGGNVVFYEVDLKGMSEHKKAVIESHGLNRQEVEIRYVPANFHEESPIDALLMNGFDRQVPTCFICEGISFFLEKATIHKLLQQIKNLMCCEAIVTLDYVFRDYVEGNLDYYGAKETHAELIELGEPHIFGLNYDEVENLFNEFGYEIKNNYTSKMLELGYLADQGSEKSAGRPCAFFGLTEASLI